MSNIKINQAVERLIEELKNDEQYRLAWEANIAMAFKGAFYFSDHMYNPKTVHEVANKASAAFIDQLIGKDMGEADGMMAVQKLHKQAKPLS